MCVITDWIVAGSGFGGVVIAGFSLAYLIKYVEATRRQVEVSQNQLEATMQPIVVVTEEKESGGITSIGIRNVSSVPALNVTYQTYGELNSPQSQRIPVFTNVMSLSGGRLQHFIIFKQLSRESTSFDVEYESVSGRRYRTIGEWDKELTLILTIHKL
jgi:hypothetical protein